MSDCGVKITYFEPGEGSVTKITLPSFENEISSSVGQQTLESEAEGEYFQLVGETIEKEIFLYPKNTYKGLIFNHKSNEHGEVENFEIKIEGSKLSHIGLHFDKVTGDYATEMIVNGVLYKSHSPFFVIGGLKETPEIIIKITKWSKPKSFLRLTRLSLTVFQFYDKYSVLEVTSEANSSAKMFYGISVNSGKAELIDDDGDMFELYKKGILSDGLKVETYFLDEITGTFIADDVDYEDELSRTARLSLVSNLQYLQGENFIGYKMPKKPSEVTSRTAYEVLREVLTLEFYMDEQTEARFRSTVFVYPVVEANKKYNILFELMVACQSVLTMNEEGKAVIKCLSAT